MAVTWPDDASAVARFLTENHWPYHAVANPSGAQAGSVMVAADDIASFWVYAGDEAIGLIRLLDLDDVDDGSPQFDLRIAESHRGRGIGRHAVRWLTDHLFTTYPQLHRIEATTRGDNMAMRAVLVHAGYRLEGRFVEAWTNGDGTRSDALTYAILSHESTSPATAPPSPSVVNLADKLARFDEHWAPRTVAEFNGHDIMVVKVKGEFVWHHHADTDDFFLVLKGQLTIRLRDGDRHLGPGELFVVPAGVEHQPFAAEEAELMLIEHTGTPNTGDVNSAARRVTL